MFDLSNVTKVDQGMTLGTGYLCVGCHGSNTNEHVFAVNERGATPALHYTANPIAPGDHAAPGNVTGHQVWIGAGSDWYNPGTWYSGGGAHDYYLATYAYTIGGVKRFFKVVDAATFQEVDAAGANIGSPVSAASIQALGWDSTIAFNNAYGCGACHDATRTNGKLAFPHGYVNDAGAPAPKFSNRTEGIWDATNGVLQTSFIWMTKADDANGAKSLVYATGQAPAFTSQRVNIDANPDGMCLKCHLSGDKSEGVGRTY
jgi:cytochrome c553